MNRINSSSANNFSREKNHRCMQKIGEDSFQTSDFNNTGTIVASWKTNDRTITLKLRSADNQLVAHDSLERIKPISEMWICGIPKEYRNRPLALEKYLRHTYVLVGSLGNFEGRLHIHPKMRGGMLAAASAGFSAVSSTMGFFTSGNYVRLAREAGKQAQATLRVGGQECRATIEKAEDAAANTINRARFAVDQSVNNAKNATTEVLRNARHEMDGFIAGTGIETRYTARIMELQVEKALREAGRTADATFAKAGIEARQAIHLAGQEARDTTVLLSEEVNSSIQVAKEATSGLINECGGRVQALIAQMRVDAISVIQQGGGDVQARVDEIIDHGIKALEEFTSEVINLTARRIEGIIELTAREVNGIILNAGEQGRLLINEAGGEFQLRANNVLASAVQGGNVLIEAAGVQGTLMIQEAGTILRCTLHEMPKIAGQIAQQMGRNFAVGIKQAIIGVSEVDIIVNKIQNLFDSPEATDIESVVEYVFDQHQIKDHAQKALLYKTLIQGMNDPAIEEKVRFSSFIFIGAKACSDPDLLKPPGWFSGQRDLSEEIIDGIPGAAQAIVKKLRENAMDHFVVNQPIPQIEDRRDVSVEELRAQEEREKQLAQANTVDDQLLQQNINRVRMDAMHDKADADAARIRQLEEQVIVQQQETQGSLQTIESLRKMIAEQEGTIAQLRRELEFQRNRNLQ